MQVKILGTGCPKCIALEERVKKVANEHHLRIDVEKVADIDEIMSYGIMMTPGLVVNGEVKSAGKLPCEEQILRWIQ